MEANNSAIVPFLPSAHLLFDGPTSNCCDNVCKDRSCESRATPEATFTDGLIEINLSPEQLAKLKEEVSRQIQELRPKMAYTDDSPCPISPVDLEEKHAAKREENAVIELLIDTGDMKVLTPGFDKIHQGKSFPDSRHTEYAIKYAVKHDRERTFLLQLLGYLLSKDILADWYIQKALVGRGDLDLFIFIMENLPEQTFPFGIVEKAIRRVRVDFLHYILTSDKLSINHVALDWFNVKLLLKFALVHGTELTLKLAMNLAAFSDYYQEALEYVKENTV